MATKAHNRSRRWRRVRRICTTLARRFLLALLARVLAILVLMLLAHWLHLPVYGWR